MSGCVERPRGTTRRLVLSRLLQGGLLLLSLLGGLSLARFLGYSVKPPPRQIRVTRRLNPGMSHHEAEFILFVGEDECWAVSRRCTHLGCTVAYRELEKVIECPCHQSRFSPRGKRLSGPAVRDLSVFPVELLRDEAGGEVTGYLVLVA